MTPQNFLNILKGNSSGVTGGNGKVLKSTKESKVFVNFADHGGPGHFVFPHARVYANELIAAFDYMHNNSLYGQMVLYIEACESGSMFDGLLPNDTGIYVVTAAGTDEPSFGTYCYPNDVVDNIHIGTCLGDLFSVNWLEDAQSDDAS